MYLESVFMRLTKQSSYAVRTLMYCASNDTDLSRIADIAKAYSISELFLFKLIKPLVADGMLETLRGRKGGVRLGRPASEISLLKAIQLTEDNFALAECFVSDDIACPLVNQCAFNGALREALDAFFNVLGNYTIEDLVKNRMAMRDLLGIAKTADQKGGPAPVFVDATTTMA